MWQNKGFGSIVNSHYILNVILQPTVLKIVVITFYIYFQWWHPFNFWQRMSTFNQLSQSKFSQIKLIQAKLRKWCTVIAFSESPFLFTISAKKLNGNSTWQYCCVERPTKPNDSNQIKEMMYCNCIRYLQGVINVKWLNKYWK